MTGVDPIVESQASFEQRVAKVLAEELRIKILEELNKRAMSPTQFFNEFGGGSVPRVWRHFRVLEKYGWIEKVGKKSGGRRRGGTEYFYRATQPAVFFNEAWAPLPDSMKEKFSARILEEINTRIVGAMEAGTFDARPDRHFTSTPLLVDERGWLNVLATVDGAFRFLFDEQERSRVRMAESGEQPIAMTVALAAFESPKDTRKAP